MELGLESRWVWEKFAGWTSVHKSKESSRSGRKKISGTPCAIIRYLVMEGNPGTEVSNVLALKLDYLSPTLYHTRQ